MKRLAVFVLLTSFVFCFSCSKTTREGQTPSPVPSNMVRIPGGTFIMGSPADEPGRLDDEGPQHQVTISSFYMAKYPVTQAEFQAVKGANPSYFKGDNLPVESISWYEAVEYCNLLSQKEGLRPAYTISGTNVTWRQNANGYRLPTEAEWEYACRAGTTTLFHTGDNITTGEANYNGVYAFTGNAGGIYREKTTEVGSFAPNSWGLYDMHGNVYEWCWDWSGSYSVSPQKDPVGAASGTSRVIRGGSWFDFGGRLMRSAARNSCIPFLQHPYIGFRLVRS